VTIGDLGRMEKEGGRTIGDSKNDGKWWKDGGVHVYN